MKTKEATTLGLMRKIVRASTRIEQQVIWMEEARRKQADAQLAAEARDFHASEAARLARLLQEDMEARHRLVERLGLSDRFRREID